MVQDDLFSDLQLVFFFVMPNIENVVSSLWNIHASASSLGFGPLGWPILDLSMLLALLSDILWPKLNCIYLPSCFKPPLPCVFPASLTACPAYCHLWLVTLFCCRIDSYRLISSKFNCRHGLILGVFLYWMCESWGRFNTNLN